MCQLFRTEEEEEEEEFKCHILGESLFLAAVAVVSSSRYSQGQVKVFVCVVCVSVFEQFIKGFKAIAIGRAVMRCVYLTKVR